MTFREKLQMEHPEYVNGNFGGGCKNCPDTYGYEEKSKCDGTSRNCYYCWNREMPNTEPKADGIPVIPQSEVDASINGYRQGRSEGYNEGLNDALEMVKMCLHMEASATKRIFGYEFVIDILENYTPQEALAKLKAYEEAQSKIEVGDVVTYSGERGMVLDSTSSKCVVLTHDGLVQEWYECDVEKTGKHLEIQQILEQIGE